LSAGQPVLLAGAGVLAGICGAVAGLASLVSYPALLAAGLAPLVANVTNTVALVLSGVGSSAASRPELRGQAGRVRRLLAVTTAGGLAGAVLLLSTPPGLFRLIVPVLIGGASVLLLAQPRMVRLTSGRLDERGPAVSAALFAVAVYGGYFGAGAGVLMLAVLAVSVPEPLARLNALKNVSLGAANTIAAAGFALFGPVRWEAAAPLAAGFLLGGALGPALVRRLPQGPLRVLIAVAGLALAAKLGLDALH
jgi:uncharacterized membrane protein YfcA